MRVFLASVIVAFSLGRVGLQRLRTRQHKIRLPAPTAGANTVNPAPVANSDASADAKANTDSSAAPTPTPPSGIVTIIVIGVDGAQSFSPNPATLPAGQMVVWHNIDTITHRVVLNDGSLDTGNINAGASSQPIAINMGGGPYHCSIHPSMVGTIVPATTASPYRVR